MQKLQLLQQKLQLLQLPYVVVAASCTSLNPHIFRSRCRKLMKIASLKSWLLAAQRCYPFELQSSAVLLFQRFQIRKYTQKLNKSLYQTTKIRKLLGVEPQDWWIKILSIRRKKMHRVWSNWTISWCAMVNWKWKNAIF